MWPALPAQMRSGYASAIARFIESAIFATWLMRAVHEAGKIGLKIEPSGATTSIARKMPLFCGITARLVTSSSRIERMIENTITCVEPENGQLKPVASGRSSRSGRP